MDYIYARVSTDKQEAQNQVTELTRKYPEAKVVSEVMTSRRERPKLKKLLSSLQEGDRLIIWKLDRIGRSMLEIIGVCTDLDARGITMISDMEGFDFSKPGGKMMVSMLAAMAEMERQNISDRTKLGLKAARARRDAPGGKPWKSRVHSKGGRRAKPRDPRMIKRLKAIKDTGMSWQRVVEALAYENPEWKIGKTLASQLYQRA